MTDNRWTWHGGGLVAAKARYGAGREPWLDLSTGINPHPWPGANAVWVDWERLPEEQCLRELEVAAAAHFGCDPELVCAVPGTEVGLRLIGPLLLGPAFHAVPSYRTHAGMIAGSKAVSAERWHDADGATLVLANPNNPDGRLLDPGTLGKLLARRGTDGWLVMDEAFVDCHPGASIASWVSNDARLLVFRSFGKFFGLAGVRLGFVLGPRRLLAALRERLGAWPLSAAAIAIGAAAYRDHRWIAAMLEQLAAEAAALDAMLARQGFAATGASPLFRLIETDEATALFERLARRAILTRPFDGMPRWLRVGLPRDAAGLDQLERALGDG